MTYLYLDGIHDLTHKLEEYQIDIPTLSFHAKKDIWVRLGIFLHTALTLIRAVALQLLRGTGNLLGGIIHLNGARVVMGMKDYFSLLIQAIALPVLGMVTFVLPKTGYHLLHGFTDFCDTPRQASAIVYKQNNHARERLHKVRQALAEMIMGIFGGASALIQTVTATLEYFLSFNGSGAVESVHYTGELIFSSTLAGMTSCCRTSPSAKIFLAHRIILML
jgi:hypothetical protein